MYLKKTLLIITLFFISSFSAAAVYEASALHNSVTRSETVLNLFQERWDSIIEREQYLDVYSRINWVPGFKIRTFNRGSGQKESIKMTLVRTYGSLSLCIPLIGGYEKGAISKRLQKKTAADASADTESSSVIDKHKLIMGLTATGFHYGLTRRTEIDRGLAGSESVTDYRYTQFFDDIFALSLIYLPYVYVHTGVIVSNQIEPDVNGTMHYSDSREGFPKFRYFLSSNAFSFLNVNATTSESRLEKIGTTVEINPMIKIFTKKESAVPSVCIGYSRLNLYNDEDYDAVWVGSSTVNGIRKTISLPNADKSHARLHTLSLELKKDFGNILLTDVFSEFQYCPETLIEKRNNKEIDMAVVRELRGSVGINFFGFSKKNNTSSLVALFGLGYFWDPAIALQRESGYGYSLNGFTASLKYENTFFGTELRLAKNYSTELRRLAETADKYSFELSLFGRF